MVIEFRLLGDLEVFVNGQAVDAGHARQRCVLAVLLVEANHAVSAAELIDRVWGEQCLPSDPRSALRTYVSLLRRALDGADDVSITRQAGGYKLVADAMSIDMHRFGVLVSQAGGSNDVGAVALLEQALGLWRGDLLAHLDTPWINSIRLTLAARRHAAQLDLADAQLRLGHHAAVIAGLSEQVSAHPLDERMAGQYITALYRGGRQADALGHYRQIRQRLVDELGTEPGAALRHLHQEILRFEPALSVKSGSPLRTTLPEVPRQLPADVTGFIGRGRYLAKLDLLLPGSAGDPEDQEGVGARPAAVVIFAVSGTAGVGKTALAVHWAHQAAGRFPDGQLYVNLRGYDPERPLTPGEALGCFLRALGVEGRDIPSDAAECAAQFRSLLAGRRMLLLLDNAKDAEQVRLLLPGNPACVTLVTSRSSLTGLVARDGAVRLDLDLLPAGEAVNLLRALIGHRADAESGLLALLAEQCARLPLALRVAAELANSRPAIPLADLVAELSDEQRRLDLLEAGEDPRTAVRVVFSWSCRQLDSGTLQVFRLAGLHHGPDIDPHAVAALAGCPLRQASQALDRLARVHLVYSVTPGRYGMHDLLRAYALELAIVQVSEPERREAMTRLLGYQLYAASSAMDALFPAEDDQRPPAPQPGTPVPLLTEQGPARDWLDANRVSLVAAAEQAAAHGWPGYASRLAAAIFRYLDHGGHYAEATVLHTCAWRAARQAGDRAAEANALIGLGVIDYHQGRFQEAVGRLEQALSLSRAAADRPGEARSLSNLGIAEYYLARYEESIGHLQQAVALFTALGYRVGAARTLGNLGTAEGRLGRHESAIAHLSQALGLHGEAGNRVGEAYALTSLGSIYQQQGIYQQAADHQHRAMAIFRAVGNRRSEARALTTLGDICRLRGNYQQANGYHQQSLEVFRQISDLSGETEALNGLGEAFLVGGDPVESHARHIEALTVASQIGDRYGQARAHEGLGHACHIGGDPAQGRHHWREALALYAAIGTPEADRVRAQLNRISDVLSTISAAPVREPQPTINELPNIRQTRPAQDY